MFIVSCEYNIEIPEILRHAATLYIHMTRLQDADIKNKLSSLWQQDKHTDKLMNKLEALKNELKQTHQEIFNTTYLAELQADLLNPQKP